MEKKMVKKEPKYIECKLTPKQIYFLLQATHNWKKKFRNYFLDRAGVVRYLQGKLHDNIKPKECRKFKQEWQKDLAVWREKYTPKKKVKIEKQPEIQVWKGL